MKYWCNLSWLINWLDTAVVGKWMLGYFLSIAKNLPNMLYFSGKTYKCLGVILGLIFDLPFPPVKDKATCKEKYKPWFNQTIVSLPSIWQ